VRHRSINYRPWLIVQTESTFVNIFQ